MEMSYRSEGRDRSLQPPHQDPPRSAQTARNL